MTLVGWEDPGVVILATYRVARRLDPETIASFDTRVAPLFAVEEFSSPDAMRAALAKAGQGAIAVALGGERIKLRPLRLKVPGATADSIPAAPPVGQWRRGSSQHAM